jgi:hypothetical protein
MNDQLKEALQQNIENLIKELSRFDGKRFNQRPASGGWTPAQIAEHLLVIERRTINVLSGKREAPEAGRSPDAHVAAMEARLTDRINKIDAPPALVPSEIPKEKQELTDTLIAARQELVNMVSQQDMHLLLPEFPHRLFGVLTGLEWAQFTILHTNRHIEQLKEMA